MSARTRSKTAAERYSSYHLQGVDVSDEPEFDSAAEPSLSRYTVIEKLAVGGMATVFVAQRNGAHELCVIKQLHPHLAEDKVVGNRFLREAQVAALLDHPRIARLTDAGREGGNFYLAMEFIAGQDLESMMHQLMAERRMLPPALTLTLGCEVLEALEYAHNFRDADGNHLGLVHRDLSPRNVMVTFDGHAKVIDFGLARTTALGDFRTAPGMLLGTLRYMSPEQATAEPADRRSDLYSWAVVLYEALSGRPLVMGDRTEDVLRTVVQDVPPPLSSHRTGVPPALDAVFARALAKKRDQRFPTASEFKAALVAAAGQLTQTNAALIADFTVTLCPQVHARAQQLLARLSQEAPLGDPDEAPMEPTRAAPLDALPLASQEPPLEPTRTAPAPTQIRVWDSAPKTVAPAPPPRPWRLLGAVASAALVAVAALFLMRPKNPEPAPVVPTAVAAVPVPVQRVAPSIVPVETPQDAGVAPKRERTRVNPPSEPPSEPPPPPPPPARPKGPPSDWPAQAKSRFEQSPDAFERYLTQIAAAEGVTAPALDEIGKCVRNVISKSVTTDYCIHKVEKLINARGNP